MGPMARSLSLTDQVRRAIDAAPASRAEICRAAGFSEATMSRFMNGRGGLSMEMLDRIAAYLDLRLAPHRSHRTRRR